MLSSEALKGLTLPVHGEYDVYIYRKVVLMRVLGDLEFY